MGYDHLSISHFFPFFFPLPLLASSGRSPKFFAYHSSIGSSRLVLLISGISFTSPDWSLSVEKYKELTLFFSLPNSLKILDSVSSVLDSWLVLVSTIPKPPNTLILATCSCPAYLKVAHPSAFNCWDPFRNHRNQRAQITTQDVRPGSRVEAEGPASVVRFPILSSNIRVVALTVTSGPWRKPSRRPWTAPLC